MDLVRVYQFRDRDRICCYDVSVSQAHALDRLRRLGPLTMNGIAESLYVDKSTASRLVDGLEEKGYARRNRGEGDRRRSEVTITRGGQRLAMRIEHDMLRAQEAVLGGFTFEEQATIAQALEKLAAAEASRVSYLQGIGSWS